MRAAARRSPRLRRAALVAAGIATLLMCSSAGLVLGSLWRSPSLPARLGTTAPFHPHVRAAAHALQHRRHPGTVRVARALSERVPLYRHPGATHPYRRLSPLPFSYGTPLVFLVEGRRGRWLHVSLPVRPNHSEAWIKASGVSLSSTDLRVDVYLRRHRLTVHTGHHLVLRAPVGVGRAVTPTPGGRYFITYLLRPSETQSVFGRYAFGLSAYSNVLTSFAGGDGEIGLHGTNDPSGLGTDVSHGCIRVSNRVITRLAHLLPLGTPVVIHR